jgi:hypothetical protein
MEQLPNKVTADHIHSRIKNVRFTRFEGETTTLCTITMVNGFVVHGISNCVDPSIFEASIGERLAYVKAFDKLWELEGYLLAEQRSSRDKEHGKEAKNADHS